jgi:hypothetical protein
MKVNINDFKWLDQFIWIALTKRKKVELYLCTDEEGGFGIKINGKIVSRNQAWEAFEVELSEKEKEKLKQSFATKPKQ